MVDWRVWQLMELVTICLTHYISLIKFSLLSNSPSDSGIDDGPCARRCACGCARRYALAVVRSAAANGSP